MEDVTILTLNKPNITDFAKERNELMKKAKTEWVFFVDKDEHVSPNLKKEIVQVLKPTSTRGEQAQDKIVAYNVRRRIYFCGELVGQDKATRLIKKNSGKWVRSVHEVFEFHSRGGSPKFWVLKNTLIHETAKNLHEYIVKMNNFSTLHAKENLKEGKKSNIIKIIIFPIAKFVQNILMGRGIVFSIMQSFHSFLGWVKMLEL